MPWTDTQHAAAVAAMADALATREIFDGLDVDTHPRVVEALALENTGTTTVPTMNHRRAIDRAIRSGRHERWSTVVWRCRLAARLARQAARRQAFTSDDPIAVLEEFGLIDRAEAERRAQALRDGKAAPLAGNRAERRARRRGGHR